MAIDVAPVWYNDVDDTGMFCKASGPGPLPIDLMIGCHLVVE